MSQKLTEGKACFEEMRVVNPVKLCWELELAVRFSNMEIFDDQEQFGW